MLLKTARARSLRGAATVEFALVVSMLMTIVIGIVSYAMMLSFRQAISQGAAEGARAAAVSANATTRYADARGALDDALTSYGVTCHVGDSGGTGDLKRAGKVVGTCTVADSTCSGHDCVNVTLNYAYKDNAIVPAFPGLGIFLPQHLSYTASARVS